MEDPREAREYYVRGTGGVPLLWTVERAVDGNICDISLDGETTRVRLAGSDAPAPTQAYGAAAKKALEEFVGELVSVRTLGNDDGHPRVCLTHWPLDSHRGLCATETINLWLVREGWAWHDSASDADEGLEAAEREARKSRRGLWRGRTKPVRPSEWRQMTESERLASHRHSLSVPHPD